MLNNTGEAAEGVKRKRLKVSPPPPIQKKAIMRTLCVLAAEITGKKAIFIAANPKKTYYMQPRWIGGQGRITVCILVLVSMNDIIFANVVF